MQESVISDVNLDEVVSVCVCVCVCVFVNYVGFMVYVNLVSKL